MKKQTLFKCPICGRFGMDYYRPFEYKSGERVEEKGYRCFECSNCGCSFMVEFYHGSYCEAKDLLFRKPDRTAELEKEIEELGKYISSQNKGLRISGFLHKNLELQKENAELKERIAGWALWAVDYKNKIAKLEKEIERLKETLTGDKE